MGKIKNQFDSLHRTDIKNKNKSTKNRLIFKTKNANLIEKYSFL